MDVHSALRESEERYRSVVTAMSEGVVLQDASSTILACNAAAERLLGLSREQMTGRTSLDPRWRAIHEDGSPFPGDMHPVPVTLRTGEPQRDVVMGVYKPDGTLTWLVVNSQPVFLEGERKPYAAVCTFSDITRRKVAEDALRDSEDLYRRILDTTLEGVWAVDLDGKTTFANRRMAEMLGVTPERLRNENLWDFVAEEDRDTVAQRMQARAKGVADEHDFRFRRPDGTFVLTNMVATAITHADGRKGALAFVRDVTESRRIERERSDYEAWLNLALLAGGMATWEWDLATGRVTHSPQMLQLLGLPPDADGSDRDVFLARVHPDDREAHIAKIKRFAESGTAERFFHEVRVVRPDGQVRWLQSTGRALRDAASGAVRVLGAVMDVTERRGLEEHLQQSGKLESIGRLAGGVAHDFNNLLTVILTSVELAERSPANVPDGLATIRDAAERAAALTRQLLAFARKQVVDLVPTDLNGVVAALEPMLRRLLGEDIQLSFHLAEGLWTVRSDVTQLQQVLINLAVNAREAMPSGGPVTIETANAVLDASHASYHPDVTPGEYVALTVTDAGVGIDGVTLQHIFEPFFTTKKLGTGLGLASSYGIVKQLGGHIWVYSEPGKGTTFKVYFPRVQAAPTTQRAPAAVRPRAPAEKRTVLVVEDDALLRRVVVRGLGDLGFDVLVAADGEEALAIATAHTGPIHAVITDVVMPRMSGSQLADQLRTLRPDTEILFVSGYTDQTIARHGVVGLGRRFLSKPYTIDALAERLGELLDGA